MRAYLLSLFILLSPLTLFGQRDKLHRCLVDELHELDKEFTPIRLTENELTERVSTFIFKFKERHPVTERENRHFMALKDNPKSDAKLYFEVENAILKRQNDIDIKDKDLVTAMENLYKERLLAKVASDPLLSDALVGSYADFKSMRLAFKNDSPELKKRLQVVYKETGDEYADELHQLGFDNLYGKHPDLSGNASSWHLSGIGESADEASLYARDVRRQYHEGIDIQVATKESSKKYLETLASELELKRSAIEKTLLKMPTGKNALTKVPNTNHYVLNPEANDIFRKAAAGDHSKYLSDVKSGFKEKFGIVLNNEQVDLLRSYYQSADLFSPSIYSPVRVILPVDSAPKTVISVDLVGQGARNATEVQKALVGKSFQVGEVTKRQRVGESVATEDMKKRIEEVVEIVDQSYQRSGTKLVLSPNEMESVLEKRGVELIYLHPEDRANLYKEFTLTPQERRGVLTTRTHHSGDDIVYIPQEDLSTNFRSEFRKEISLSPRRAEYRPVHLDEHYYGSEVKITPEQKNKIISDGETLEKELRKRLTKNLTYQDARERGITIEISADLNGNRHAKVFVSGKGVTPEVAKALQTDLAETIKTTKLNGPVIIDELNFSGGL